jgi:acyl-coenzyme A thioesterase PaaI-like protein
MILDQLLGEVATDQLTTPKYTGTITVKYLRGTPLGPLRAEAFIERSENHKTYARGFISDAHGATAEAEGVFIMPVWARDGGGRE